MSNKPYAAAPPRQTTRQIAHSIMATLIAILISTEVLAAGEISTLNDSILREDTTWSGTVLIDGVVVVGRRAILTIKPGTTILFKRRDTNLDGIGDSELRVLGGLKATGTPGQPIIFKSAEVKPAPKDWSYVLIFTSGKMSILDYCQFHDAFSGLQVHFSTALVSNCLFSSNNEGIRFGRAKLKMRHCQITNNGIGVRFTRMEGPVEIQRNDINNNQVGIFLVPSGQNIVDFFEPGRTGKPWNEGHLDISFNNINANHDYNLKLGAKQLWDLKVSNNWWGTSSAATAHQQIFDQQRDQELGRAIIEPLASAPVPETGIKKTPLTRP
ncbi:MAG: right-handed parallel beta-helix repeat-containing protein [Proteobacteria bacterium]|nr:right-handed parallel beta-helix repeat-containing protein [Desulfobulbaceae bacterium]MBU4154533.1 right-handed parallel beta-helix repeat-containing protein [Pseudomonadota bacterium]